MPLLGSCIPHNSETCFCSPTVQSQLPNLPAFQNSPISNGYRRSPCSLPSTSPTNPDHSALQSPYSESPLPWFLRSSPEGPHCLNNNPHHPPSPDIFYSALIISSPSLYLDDIDGAFTHRSRGYHCITTVEAHKGQVSAVAAFGKLLYTGFAGMKSILVLKKPLFFEYTKFGYGYGSVKTLLVTDDNIYVAHDDNKIRVWHRHRGRQQRLRHKLTAVLPTFRDSLSNFIRRDKERYTISHVDTITALALGQNGLFYSSSWDKTVKVWKLSNSRCIESIDAHEDAVNALVAGCDGLLYTGSADSKVKVWRKIPSVERHQLVRTLEAHKSAVNAVALSSDETILYSGGSDCLVRIWERANRVTVMSYSASLSGHRHAILCLAVAGNIVCSGSADKTILVWKRHGVALHSCVTVLEGHQGPVKCLCASVDTKARCLVYSGSTDCTLKVWKVAIEEIDDDKSFERKEVAPARGISHWVASDRSIRVIDE